MLDVQVLIFSHRSIAPMREKTISEVISASSLSVFEFCFDMDSGFSNCVF